MAMSMGSAPGGPSPRGPLRPPKPAVVPARSVAAWKRSLWDPDPTVPAPSRVPGIESVAGSCHLAGPLQAASGRSWPRSLRQLPKLNVAGSIPVARSTPTYGIGPSYGDGSRRRPSGAGWKWHECDMFERLIVATPYEDPQTASSQALRTRGFGSRLVDTVSAFGLSTLRPTPPAISRFLVTSKCASSLRVGSQRTSLAMVACRYSTGSGRTRTGALKYTSDF